jgi:hypothetical protein
MTLKFTPPENSARYALSIGKFFKTYDELSRAKIAWHSHGRYTTEVARILEMVDGSWFTLYTVQPGTSAIDLPWYAEVYGYVRGIGYRDRRRSKPMTADEYADWRLRVDRELMTSRTWPEISALLA